MRYLDATYPTPAENLACDEALLEAAEAGLSGEVLRFWTPGDYFAVLGYAGAAEKEVARKACREDRIPVLRRCSGGGTVLQGPGCLNYTLVLALKKNASFKNIVRTNRFILTKHKEALQGLLGGDITLQGISDLAKGAFKFSGNAQRRKRNHLLFHGTFLLDFEIEKIEKYLKLPERRPAYRKDRSHRDFLTNLTVGPEPVKKTLREAWSAQEPFQGSLDRQIKNLAAGKYADDAWNLKF